MYNQISNYISAIIPIHLELTLQGDKLKQKKLTVPNFQFITKLSITPEDNKNFPKEHIKVFSFTDWQMQP